MDNAKLKELVIEELSKKVPADKVQDKTKLREFVLANVNEPLMDKLVAEFCAQNTEDFAVLNTFDFNNEEQNAAETVESIKYKTFVNSAGLAYRRQEVTNAIQELNGLVG